MTSDGRARLGARTNLSPANNASWVVALAILAVIIPASETVAKNEVFFAAHGVSPIAWVVLLVLVVVAAWAVLFGVFALVRRASSATVYDVVVSAVTMALGWFLVGNILARTVLSGAPVLAIPASAVIAAGVVLLARRFAMGTILVVFAGAAAALPLVLSLFSSGGQAPPQIAFADGQQRPDVVWVLADELQYPLVFDQQGNVRPEFPNLAALADQATTYTKAYSVANYTDYAVPSMLNGITDVAEVGADRMQKVRAGIGIVPALSSEYSIVMDSPIYSFECDSEDCASVGSGEEVGALQRYWAFARDTAAIAGRTALAAPFSQSFPSLDGKWRDFWSGGDEFGEGTEADSVTGVIDSIATAQDQRPDSPVFAFWHTIRTHAPWVVDLDGRPIYPSRVPVVEGAHMIGAEADQTYTTDELKRLERRLYAASAVDFDRQLGELLSALRESGRYDDTMVIVTADHGATMTERSDRRVGDDLVQRWSEVAHVPLVVKTPGQTTPEIVTDPRSAGQIAATVVAASGGTPGPDLVLAPPLDQEVPGGPVFTTVAGGQLTPWRYSGVQEVDPWLPEDLSPDPAFPFAVGADPEVLGGPVPEGWVQVTPTRTSTLSGESDQKVVIVDRPSDACAADTRVGLVSAAGTVIGSVLWEGEASAGSTRGWAIVPASDDYGFWCPAS